MGPEDEANEIVANRSKQGAVSLLRTRPDGSPYDFSIDLDSDNTHASVIRMVGRSRRVLELGPASGYMSRILRERGCTVVGVEIAPDLAAQAAEVCERVIVGDLDVLDLDAELGDDRFDAIVAGDVLEHLKDPLAVLVRLRAFLKQDGFFVVSLPNIAHASVRLALLQGRFQYQELGLMDRTHLHFFTHDTIRQLFDEAELAMVEVHRQEAPIAIDDAPFDQSAVPADVLRALESDPDARTYQFVVKAVPLALPGMRELQGRLHEQALALDAAERELARTEPHAEQLEKALAEVSAREGKVRAALIEAHDQVLRRDEEIERMIRRFEERTAEFQDEREQLREQHTQLERRLTEQREHDALQIAARDEHIRRLKVRLERILSTPPARMYARLGQLPLIRRVVARRNAGYEQILKQGEPADE